MQHFTKNTLEAARWCNHCKKSTPHKVFNGRMSNVCIPCEARNEAEHQARIAAGNTDTPAAIQLGMFA
jgi:hypothetical protein